MRTVARLCIIAAQNRPSNVECKNSALRPNGTLIPSGSYAICGRKLESAMSSVMEWGCCWIE